MNDALGAQRAGLDPVLFEAIRNVGVEADAAGGGPTLPTDHPVWQRDVLSISSRARAILATLRPLAINVLTFWDHRLRELAIGAQTLAIDPSGCYRLR